MIPLFSDVAMNKNLDFLGAVKKVLDRHWYVLGEEVTGFETEFAEYVGVGHCISMANGTDAIEIALRSVGVERNDLVVTVANAGFYSSTAIHAIGATPLYVDIDPSTMTMSVDALAQALKQKPKCVIVTHLYGQLANIEELLAQAKAAGVKLIEDCAQSHGAKRNGRQAGSFGDAACFSFYPTKNLGAMGDGGAVVTSDSALAVRLKTLRQYGWSSKYHVGHAGGKNSRLDEMQAAILRIKLPLLDSWNASRRDIAIRYNAAFANLGFEALPSVDDSYAAHLYVARLKNRDTFRDFLKSEGVTTDVHYPVPDHKQAAYTEPCVVGTLEVTESTCKDLVTLPCFPGMADEAVEAVITAVKKYFAQ
ncbi:dTDP-3-amino-3,6-dideoxy-alpha-D-galactopyranose transaminase [Pseudomonas fluorescens]|uniref:dTDP-3-amino-3,6-dideoxy-alpha-D-galactopyranose transaminase n=1 Tax=Pseudomonas fluorescens TaxID=294 RepID=A0A5E7D305_PSEFL|nr:DegT/DnrJ/EryC1/StrS family aminotransferase [Pseudomonas fluorescens]VVO02234.1 dTDP-3-amino-3,6-dideoxy-alpha-D-galactopyranose transaminase [Pseudomonas fluorescens]